MCDDWWWCRWCEDEKTFTVGSVSAVWPFSADGKLSNSALRLAANCFVKNVILKSTLSLHRFDYGVLFSLSLFCDVWWNLVAQRNRNVFTLRKLHRTKSAITNAVARMLSLGSCYCSHCDICAHLLTPTQGGRAPDAWADFRLWIRYNAKKKPLFDLFVEKTFR